MIGRARARVRLCRHGHGAMARACPLSCLACPHSFSENIRCSRSATGTVYQNTVGARGPSQTLRLPLDGLATLSTPGLSSSASPVRASNHVLTFPAPSAVRCFLSRSPDAFPSEHIPLHQMQAAAQFLQTLTLPRDLRVPCIPFTSMSRLELPRRLSHSTIRPSRSSHKNILSH